MQNRLLFVLAPAALFAQLVASPAHAQDPGVAGTPLVNAPVAPEAIYIARTGAEAKLSVIDLNGFGQGTGNPAFDPIFSLASEGTSMFPHNPNVAFQGALLTPPLAPGTSTLDGGSAGVFTLTKDTALMDVLGPSLGTLGDMMLGHPLDMVFNSGPPPFGCQAGGGSICSTTGLQLVGPAGQFPSPTSAPIPSQVAGVPGSFFGLGNPITWAPHPNPPPLLTTPLCVSPDIAGQEPTSIDSLKMGLFNLLGPGNPFGVPSIGIPPSGLLRDSETTQFVGPSSPQTQVASCEPYQMRQQIGHFLYAVDRRANELVILNSNRMTVLGRIALSEPTELAMDPNLRFLAVTNKSAGTVSFINIEPSSVNFHQIVATVAVGAEPTGIAWQPDGEDILVCNSGTNTVSVISAFSFAVRKTVSLGANAPVHLAVTPRHDGYGAMSGVYYAWIVDSEGRVWVFESGPSGVNGWGYDDVVLASRWTLDSPSAIQLDPLDPMASAWVTHDQSVDALGHKTGLQGGAVTQVHLNIPTQGIVPVIPGSIPNARGKFLSPTVSIGGGALTGYPTDLAFDNLSNLGVYPNPSTLFSAGAPIQMNGKHPMRTTGQAMPTNRAQFMFLPVRDSAGAEWIDVIDLVTGMRKDTNGYQVGVQSIPAEGAHLVMDYFRQ